jgi:hypothetical protein
MINHPASILIERLNGLSAWGALVGPAGMQLDFGVAHPSGISGGQPRGDYSIWVKCPIRIQTKSEIIFEAAYPEPLMAERLKELLNGKTVDSADIDIRNCSLRIVFREEFLFSAYPSVAADEFCWIIFRRSPLMSVVTFKDGFKGEWSSEKGDISAGVAP